MVGVSRPRRAAGTLLPRLGWGLAAMLAALRPAEATPARVRTPTAGAAVVVGSVVEVSWTPLPPEAKEMELYLSLDGGRSYPLRLTPQLPPGLTTLLWRVPNLPTPAARLRLRVGIPGRGEVDAAPSPMFRIVAPGPVSAEPVVLRSGELWLGRGGDAAPLTPSSLADAGEEVSALHHFSPVGEAPRGPRLTLTAHWRGLELGRDVTSNRWGRLPPTRPGETAPLPLRR